MAHIVTCVYCKNKFDRDKIPFIEISSRRYAHKDCAPNTNDIVSTQKKSDGEYEELLNYTKKLLGDKYIDAVAKKQIRDFRQEYDYTYSGMLKTLYYWYKIKNKPVDKNKGVLGIIPYVYQEASQYYYALYLASITNEELTNASVKEVIKTYTIEPPEIKPQYKRNIRLFNLGEEE